MLKKKLREVLETGVLPAAKPKVSQEQIAKSNEMRQLVQKRLSMSLPDFLRTRATFHPKHGMAYKLSKTSPQRLRDSTLCSHDLKYWLQDHKHSTAAAWVLKLAGPEAGQVSRNQMLQWSKKEGKTDEMEAFYKWTRKWGFKDTDITKTIMAQPISVSEARKLYSEFKSRTKQAYGNKLSDTLIEGTSSKTEPEEVYAFFRMSRKDIVTFQLILAAMIQEGTSRKHLDEVWTLAKRQENANNSKIDEKLMNTYERICRLKKKHETNDKDVH